ncbi:MAG: LacI family DNA-binding transcriptional regulator [Kiritimatiellae bacterium]|nr:LacI family DNA-binding transcriptional regulator [Kiritimatiellia bacterium]
MNQQSSSRQTPISVPRRPNGSLRLIAEKAGVTKATASRVLNNRYNGFSVRPEVKRRILEAAVEIGYAPDLVARGLRAERMNLVGAVGLQPPYVVVNDVFLAIVDVLSREGVHLSLHLAPSAEAADRPPPWRVDGLFVISTESAELIKPIDASGLPYVTLNAPSGPNGAAVLFDDEQGTRLAMQHLADLGHRRIAYANADAPGHYSLRLRHRSYAAFMEGLGAPVVPVPGFCEGDDPVGFLRAIRAAGATAVLTYYHHAAIRLSHAAFQLGLRVPRDLSIVCFNNAYGTESMNPALTAVALPYAEAGAAAAEMLLALIRGETLPARERIFPESLVVRESSGPVGPSPARAGRPPRSISRPKTSRPT